MAGDHRPRCETPPPKRKEIGVFPPAPVRGLVAWQPPACCGPASDHMAEPLSKAIKHDDLSAVAVALDDDPLVLCRTLRDVSEPAVMYAIRNGCSPSLVQLLLRHGADPNERGRDGACAMDLVVRAALPPVFVHGWGADPSPLEMRRRVTRAFWSGLSLCGPAMLPLDAPTAAVGPALWSETPRVGAAFHEPFFVAVGAVAGGLMVVPPSEAKCCEYATALLQHGAGATEKDHPTVTACADVADSTGRVRLAHLLRHWNGRQVAAVRAMIRSHHGLPLKGVPVVAGPAGVGRAALAPDGRAMRGPNSALLGLPEVVHAYIFEMLAPSCPVVPGEA